ncbi:DMT family transporter [Granulicella sibirica]|uniref:Permease of the drug/metabolite transporter (DMT) superfamily n=1 Tax=Granulicella sibirica TaxID=2479048 RepID=A0A4Q0T608_9BACT|nr:EamA family transporter [Granulicella sibirica]RXH57528.1 Permease of the drug/metabolite transporter (DMT) superfamily [Granulicella sibirica]
MPSNTLPTHRALGFGACTLASTLWGCGFFFGKIVLAEMGVGSMVFYRFAFACLALLPVLFTHKPDFSPREWTILAFSAFLGVPVQFLLQFEGLRLTTVSHAALMVGLMPVILAVGAAVWAHERMDKIGWFALFGSSLGACLIALGGRHSAIPGGPSLAGDLLVVASLFIALFWILMNKQLMEGHNHLLVTAYGIFLGTAMLAIVVPFRYGLPAIHGISWKPWAASAAAGVLCTAVTTSLWNWGITQVPASQAGVLLNMEPLMGSLLGVFVLSEHLGPSAWLGGGLILASAITLTTQSKTRVRELEPAIL